MANVNPEKDKKPKQGINPSTKKGKPSALVSGMLARANPKPPKQEEFDPNAELMNGGMDNNSSAVVNTQPTQPSPPTVPAITYPTQPVQPTQPKTVVYTKETKDWITEVKKKHYNNTQSEVDAFFNTMKNQTPENQRMTIRTLLDRLYMVLSDEKLIPSKAVMDSVNYTTHTHSQFTQHIKDRAKKQKNKSSGAQNNQQPQDPKEGMFDRIKGSVVGGTKSQAGQLGKALKYSVFAALSGRNVEDYYVADKREQREKAEAAQQAALQKQQTPPTPAPSTLAPSSSSTTTTTQQTSSKSQQQPAPKIVVVPSSMTPEQVEEEKKYKDGIISRLDTIIASLNGEKKPAETEKEGGGLLKKLMGFLLGGGLIAVLTKAFGGIKDMVGGLFSAASGFFLTTLPGIISSAYEGIKKMAGGIADALKAGWDKLRGNVPSPAPAGSSGPIVDTPDGPDKDKDKDGKPTQKVDPKTGKTPSPTKPIGPGWGTMFKTAAITTLQWGFRGGVAGTAASAPYLLADAYENSEEGKQLRANQKEYAENYNRVMAQVQQTGKVSRDDLDYLQRNWSESWDFSLNDGKYAVANVESIVKATHDPYKPASVEPIARVADTGDALRENNRHAAYENANAAAKRDAAIINAPQTIVNNGGGSTTTIVPLDTNIDMVRRTTPFRYNYGFLMANN